MPTLSYEDAVEIRRQTIGYEVLLKSLGFVYFLGAIVCFWVIAQSIPQLPHPENGGFAEIAIAAGLVLAAMCLIVGYGFWTLRQWSPVAFAMVIFVSLFGALRLHWIVLVVFVLPQLFVGLACIAPAQRAITPEYHEVIVATPNLYVRAPRWIKVFLVAAYCGVIAAIFLLYAT